MRLKDKLQIIIGISCALLLLGIGLQSVIAAPGDGFNCDACIDKEDIAAGAVGSSELINGGVKATDIATGAVRSPEIKNGTVALRDLSTGAKRAIVTRIWAEFDRAGSQGASSSADLLLNSMSFKVPRAGFLVISGNVYVENLHGFETLAGIFVRVDGTSVSSPPVRTRFGESGTSNDRGTLSYTVTVPVTKGSHTVSQTLDPGGSESFIYDNRNLTVLFVSARYGRLTTLT